MAPIKKLKKKQVVSLNLILMWKQYGTLINLYGNISIRQMLMVQDPLQK